MSDWWEVVETFRKHRDECLARGEGERAHYAELNRRWAMFFGGLEHTPPQAPPVQMDMDL